MVKNKTSWKIHAIAECVDCGERCEDYNTAQHWAARHAAEQDHTVMGEVGYAFRYGERRVKKVPR